MNNFKEEYIQKQNKFEHIMFTLDYLRGIYQLTGTLNDDDFVAGLVRLYDIAYSQASEDVLNKYINSMFQELDAIEDQNNT